MGNKIPVFKSWAPEWLIRGSILLMMLPSLSLFGFFTTNAAATAGYYGIEPQDVQFSVVLFYGSLASFFPLEKRFFRYLASRNYFILGVFLLVLTSVVCYSTRNVAVFFIFRFLQGVFNGGVNTICITLLFRRLTGERARVIGYSYFYGLLLASLPLTMVVTSLLLDHFDMNVLFKAMAFMLIPPAILLSLIMNDVRLQKKFPLYQIEWVSYVFYFLIFCSGGYALVYGQKYNWFEDYRICFCLFAVVVLIFLFVLRQTRLKRPFIDLSIFKHPNYIFGALLLIPLYICRGSLNISTAYFSTALGMDPIHVSRLLLVNIAGVVISIVAVSRLVLLKKPVRMIFIAGFAFLLIFHVWMSFLFTTGADESAYIMPLIIQGIGSGTVMVPLIIFTISSVPAPVSTSASGAGIFFRFTGFCLSLALINFFQLSAKSEHYQSFRQQVTEVNPLATEQVARYRQLLKSRGLVNEQANSAARVMLGKAVDKQTQLDFAIDYYRLMSAGIIAIMLIIALSPYINRTVIHLKGSQPAPASY